MDKSYAQLNRDVFFFLGGGGGGGNLSNHSVVKLNSTRRGCPIFMRERYHYNATQKYVCIQE